MIKKTSIAYLAGLIDGEGCIDIHRTKHKTPQHRFEYYDLRLRIGMTTNQPVETIQQLFGGKLSISIRKGNRKQIYELFWSGDKAMNILCLIRPFLLLKLPQCNLGIEYRRYSNKYRKFGVKGTPLEVIEKRREYYTQMGRLNEHGRRKKILATE